MQKRRLLPIIPAIDNPINTVKVEDNAIKAISPSFSVLGGQPHSKGGTLIQFGNNTVEAQKGEPLSTDDKGNVVAWGKMINPLTGKIFETDAKDLAKEELKAVKQFDRGIDMVNTSDTSKQMGAFNFATGKALADAALIKQQDIEQRQKAYADTQQDILDFAEAMQVKPEKLAKKIAKKGATIEKGAMKVKITGIKQALNGLEFDPYGNYPQLMQNDRAGNAGYQPQPIIPNQAPAQPISTSPQYGGMLNTINTIGSTVLDGINAIGKFRRDISVAAPQILNGLIPDIHNKREQTVDRTYNQYAYGTGSQMMYRNGGQLAPDGTIMYTEDGRPIKYQSNASYIYSPEMQERINSGMFVLPTGANASYQIGTTQGVQGDNYGKPVPLSDLSYLHQIQDVNPTGFQGFYNKGIKQFNERYPEYAVPTDVGFQGDGFGGLDGKYGIFTSTRGRPVVPLEVPKEKIDALRKLGSFITINGQEYLDPQWAGDLGMEGLHTDGIHLYKLNTPQTPIERLDPVMPTEGIRIQGTPQVYTETPLLEDPNKPTKEQAHAMLKKNIPSYADRNRLGIADVLGEVSGLFGQPSYVPRQQLNPTMMSPYQVSFQDRINQNQAIFNQQAQALRGDPAALATLAAQARQASNAVLADEFRTNQGISNQVYNQNRAIEAQTQQQNAQLADNQFIRQEQARENTDAVKRAALQSLSAKVLQKKAENTAIRLMENMSKFRVDEDYVMTNYNPDPNFRWSRNQKPWNELSGEEKKEAYNEAVRFTSDKMKEAQNVTKKFGGNFGRRF